jgi:hypothetical protein
MSVGEDSSHASLIGQINEDLTKGDGRVPGHGEGPEGKPEPHDRPDNKAQWDEVNGRWIEWDAEAGKWIPAPERAPAPDAPEAAPAATEEATEPPAEQ